MRSEDRNCITGQESQPPSGDGRATAAVTPSAPAFSARAGVSGRSRSRVVDSEIQGASRKRARSPLRLTTTAAPVVTSASSVRAKSRAGAPVPDSGSA